MISCYCGFLKNEEELQKSSSGGLAASIAKYAIKNNGVVYGVAYTTDYKGAEYIRATSESELTRLIGSKYIFANNGELLREGLADDLVSGRLVVCFGLPCNIAGVLALLHSKNIKTDNLITVDLICGGATIPDVAKQYIEKLEQKYSSKVVDFSVRYKNPDWKPPYLRASFKNGKVFCKEFYDTEYGYAFDHMKRSSCYSCTLKAEKHSSDITIGDAHGIDTSVPAFHSKGVSVAFVHTERGEKLIKALTDMSLYEADAERMVENNTMYSFSNKKTMKDEQFRKDFECLGLQKAYKKHMGFKRRLLGLIPDKVLKAMRKIKHKLKR